jgi:hypothetical protein
MNELVLAAHIAPHFHEAAAVFTLIVVFLVIEGLLILGIFRDCSKDEEKGKDQ